MTTGNPAETALYRAIKRREELEASIKEAMQELRKIEQFIQTYREFTLFDGSGVKGANNLVPAPAAIPSRQTAYGQAQQVFEQLVRRVLRDLGRPLKAPEIIEEFRKRDHPIGGNETRTAWNRLWSAHKSGVLIRVPKYGYWLADEPVPPLPAKPPRLTHRPKGKGIKTEWAGRRIGRAKALTDAQIQLAQEWKAAGKSIKQIAADLGGLSASTIYVYLQRAEKKAAATSKKSPKGTPQNPIRRTRRLSKAR